jgi:Skp family chaperone for outer membrane proteins
MKSVYKTFIIAIVLSMTAIAVFAAETIPKMGVINRRKVTQTYFKDSKALRDLEAEKVNADEYINRQTRSSPSR